MPLTVQQEAPRQPAVAALLQQSDALAARLYPGEPRRVLTPEALDRPGISVLVVRDEAGAALGCCALLEPGDGTAELKRMIVGEAHRGRGAGVALVRAAEALAAERGVRVLRLEVGVRNTDGQALHRRAGFVPCGPFPPYRAMPISLFMEKATTELGVQPRAASAGQ